MRMWRTDWWFWKKQKLSDTPYEIISFDLSTSNYYDWCHYPFVEKTIRKASESYLETIHIHVLHPLCRQTVKTHVKSVKFLVVSLYKKSKLSDLSSVHSNKAKHWAWHSSLVSTFQSTILTLWRDISACGLHLSSCHTIKFMTLLIP